MASVCSVAATQLCPSIHKKENTSCKHYEQYILLGAVATLRYKVWHDSEALGKGGKWVFVDLHTQWKGYSKLYRWIKMRGC